MVLNFEDVTSFRAIYLNESCERMAYVGVYFSFCDVC